MARNLLVNGSFMDGTLTPWTVENVTAGGGTRYQFETPYSAHFNSTTADAYLQQDFTPPGVTTKVYRARLSMRALNLDGTTYPSMFIETKLGPLISSSYLFSYIIIPEPDVWCHLVADVAIQGGTQHRLKLTLLNASIASSLLYLDEIQLYLLDPLDLSAEGLAMELMRRRGDTAGILHAQDRYRQIVNEAILQAPRHLWTPEVDTITTTETGGLPDREYSLSTLTKLITPDQAQRAWMDDEDGYFHPVGRWEIADDGGSLTLCLDEDPPEAGRTIRLEYLTPYPSLDTLDFTDETALDREWLLSRAMSLLLLESDPAVEDPNLIALQLGRWDALRQSRELELRHRTRRPASKLRTRGWS